MKKYLLLAGLLAASLNAHATAFGSPAYTINAPQSSAAAAAEANNGGVTLNNIHRSQRNPVSSATAPGSISLNECEGWTSTGAQLFFFGGTHGHSKLLAWCIAEKMGERALARQILCNTDSDYKKARAQLGDACHE